MDNRFVFTILSDDISKKSDTCDVKDKRSHEEIQLDSKEKYTRYYLASQGLLIQKLSKHIIGIPESNIIVLANGEKEEFEMSELTEGRMIVDVDLLESFKDREKEEYSPRMFITRDNVDDLNFQYIDYKFEFASKIRQTLKGRPESHVLLFLKGKGSADRFGTLTYLGIYLAFLSKKPKSLQIYSDSINSHYIPYYINTMNNLIERIENANFDDDTLFINYKYLLPIVELAIASGKETEEAFDYVENLIVTLEKLHKKIYRWNKEYLFIKAYKGIYNTQEYKEIIAFKPETPISEFFDIIRLEKYEKKDRELLASLPDLALFLGKVGITTMSQYHEFNNIFNVFFKYFKSPSQNGNSFYTVMCKKNVDNARKIFCAKKGSTISDFHRELEVIYSQKVDPYTNFLGLKIPEDLRIFTSSPQDVFNINILSIRIGRDSKAVISSPSMSTFVEKVLRQSSDTSLLRHGENDGYECSTQFSPINEHSNVRQLIWPFVDIMDPTYINSTGAKSVVDIMHEIGYEEYKDKERIQHQIDEQVSDDDLDELYDGYANLNTSKCKESLVFEPEPSNCVISKKKIEKYQKRVDMFCSWDCNVFNFWLILFKKTLKKMFNLDFDPQADVDVERGDICTKFLHTYQSINRYVPVQTLSEMYHRLKRQIEQLLRDNEDDEEEIIELIANCFDDADRIVTPLFFTGKIKYNQ